MSELIAVGFKGDIHRASAILNRLCSMSDDWAFDLDDAIAIYRDENGNLKVDDSYKTMSGKRPVSAPYGAAFLGPCSRCLRWLGVVLRPLQALWRPRPWVAARLARRAAPMMPSGGRRSRAFLKPF